MNFAIPDAIAETLDRMAAIVDNEVIPIEAEVLERGFKVCEPQLQALRKRVKEAGLWAPQVPTELGGMGLPLLQHGLVSEVLGRSPLGHYVFGCQAPDAGNIEILHKYGSKAHHERWLEPLVAGDIRSCFSMTEPDNAGSNPTEMSTTAVHDGDDYVINGHKWFTTSADGAAFAIVMAVTNPDADRHMRASQIIVPTNTPGFELVRNIPVMGHPGDGWGSHGEIRYTDVRVPRSNRLGDEGAGFLIAQERLGPGRIHHCMRWIGICKRAHDLMCQRAASRDLGNGRTLGSRQIVQAWIAESLAKINAARLMVLEAAWKIDNQGFYGVREEISLIKFYAADVLMEVLDRAIQVHGALGITSDTPLAWWYMHERGARIYDGPDEVHKMVVAKRIMNRYAHGVDSASYRKGTR